ncbi:hypothetical protein N9L76_03305 [bacterium]|nr:hypothetical protein [bacterium]
MVDARDLENLALLARRGVARRATEEDRRAADMVTEPMRVKKVETDRDRNLDRMDRKASWQHDMPIYYGDIVDLMGS